MAHVPEKRQSHGQHDALLDPDRHDDGGGDDRKVELTWTFPADVAQPGQVDHSQRDREDDCRQHGARQVLQRAGQGEQHQQHDAGKYQLRELAAREGEGGRLGRRPVALPPVGQDFDGRRGAASRVGDVEDVADRLPGDGRRNGEQTAGGRVHRGRVYAAQSSAFIELI